MKRTPMKRKAAMSRGTKRIAHRSAKMRRAYAGPDGRAAIVARLLAARPECEACIPGVCTGRSQDVHERLRRSAGGSITDEDNLAAICRACHIHVHVHPADARARGLLVSRYPGRRMSSHFDVPENEGE